MKSLMERAREELARADGKHGVQLDISAEEMRAIVVEEAGELCAASARMELVRTSQAGLAFGSELTRLAAMVLKCDRWCTAHAVDDPSAKPGTTGGQDAEQ